MRVLFLILFLSVLSQGEVLKPYDTIEASGNVIGITIYDNVLAVSKDAGIIESYSLETKEQLSKTQFPMIKDFTGDEIYPKGFSIDFQESTKRYLAVIQGTSGFRELFTVKDGVKEKLVGEKEKLFVSKAKFVDENRVLIALLSNEYILFDIEKKEILYRNHISYSHFSDFMLNEDRTLIAGGSESGEITIIDVMTGKVVKVLKGANVDNLYKVDFKSGKVLGAGQDRRGSVYDVSTGEFQRFDATFLIYAGALSPSAEKAAFAFSEDNDIVIFDLKTDAKLYTLKGQKSTLNTIVFIDENSLVSGSDDRSIMIWKLK